MTAAAVRTRFTERGLAIARAGGDDHLDLFSGALHYWRVDPADWPACLAALRDIGLELVETYVPWSVVEGGGAPDLRAFLDAVAAAGLRALLRPGPHVNAELTGFGFPQRVLDDPAMRARTARDTPVWLPAPPRAFAVPSYAAQPFRAAVCEWYARFGERVAPYLAPGGPVVAVQVDNEQQMFFRAGAFDADYHPDALAWWNEWSGGLDPPRAWDAADAARCARWVRFKEVYAARALAWMSAALDDAGLAGVARFHNFPPTDPWLIDLPGGAAAIGGVAGIDLYHRAADGETVARRALYLAGSSPLPFAPELGVGGPPWLPPMTAADQRAVTLGALAAGLRAFNLYMAVQRDRWYGAAIADDGRVTEVGQWYARLLGALREVGWTSLRRRAQVGVVVSRADARFGLASSLADPVTPVVTEMLGIAEHLYRDAGATAHRRWLRAVRDALVAARVPHVFVDEGCGVDRFAAVDAVVMPTHRRVDRAAWRRVKAAAAQGVRVVVGPGRPAVDAFDEPLGDDAGVPRGVGRLQPGGLDDPGALAADLAAVAGGAPRAWMAREPEVDTAVFEDEAGAPRLVFARNRGDRPVDATLAVPDGATLVDALTGAPPGPRIALAPFAVRMLRVV